MDQKLIKQSEKKSAPPNDNSHWGGDGGGSGGGGGYRKRRSFDNRNDSDRAVRVINSTLHDTWKLCTNEVYRDVFHPGNNRCLEKLKKKNIETNCLRYHTVRFWFKDCKFNHGVLDTEEAAVHAAFVKVAREQCKSHQERRSRNNSQHERTDLPQSQTPAATPSATGE